MELSIIGHVIEYDPATHMARVMLPTRRAEDDDGKPQPMETGWIQVGSGWTGDGFGQQYALKGGATKEEPEKGEQVQISLQHRSTGLSAVANLTFNDKMRPPGAGTEEQQQSGGSSGGSGSQQNDGARDDPDGTEQLKPGEYIVKHESGTREKFYENGDLGVYIARNLIINIEGDCEITLKKGNLKVTLEDGDADIHLLKGDCTTTIDEGNAETHVLKGDCTTTVDEGTAETHVTLGDAITYVEEGNIAAFTDDGEIAIETSTGSVTVTAAETVDITAPVVNIISAVINAGVGLVQKLCNLAFLELFNLHVHPIPGGVSGPPTNPAIPGIETTIDLEAS
jgi:hypothetical protein